MKICLVKTSSMGDVLHTLPALTDAQQAIPHLQVDWVVEEQFAEIPRWHSAVQQVIPIALRRWRKTPFSQSTRAQWQAYKAQLQAANYDAVIDAQGLFKSAFFATRLAHGVKHGYDRQSIREPIASFFYDKKYAISYQIHAVERIRCLFAQALAYPLPQHQGDYGIAAHFLGKMAASKPYVIFFHSTTRAEKHWPESHWKALIELMTREFPALQIYLPWGNASEQARAQRLAQGNAQVLVLPKLSLTQLAATIANAQAIVAVDTGLAHLTAALNKSALTLYGPTDPALIGAYGRNQHYLQGVSMAEISAFEVMEKLMPKVKFVD